MLILKLVGYCNLACAYCYDYNQRTARSRMPLSTAQNAITQAFEQSRDGLNILFHGGEPLLAFDAIRRLVPFARAAAATLGRRVEFSIQTNGTLFTPENVEFLLGERFSIGISLDGRCPINDRLRVDYAGKGCHTAIERDLRAYPALTDQIGVLTTVTRFNVAHLLDTALYVQDLGVRRWAATLFQAAGRAAGDAPRFAPATADLAAAYRSLLDAIEQGRFTRLEVRPVLDYIRNVTSRQRRSMCLRDRCGAARELASVSVTGDVEACDCIKDMRLRIGSMENGGIPEALASPVAQSIRDRSTGGLRRCRTCEWRAFCGGTCLAKAGALDGIDRQECALARVLLPEIFRRLAASDKLERYAQLFA